MTWNIEYCSSLVKGTFGADNYQFEVNGVQTLILLLLNSSKELTVAVIKQKTGLTDELINSAIAIMAGSSSILVKTGDSYAV